MGIKSTEDGQFDFPSGIDVDSSGNVYVTDESNHRIQKFDSNGKFITKWGFNGGQVMDNLTIPMALLLIHPVLCMLQIMAITAFNYLLHLIMRLSNRWRTSENSYDSILVTF